MLYIKYVLYQNMLYTKYTLYQILTSFPCVLSLGPSSTVLQHWKVPGYFQTHIVHFKQPWNASKTCQKCFAQSAKTHWRKAQEGGWSLQPINAHTPGWRLLHRLFCLARLAWWAFLHLTCCICLAASEECFLIVLQTTLKCNEEGFSQLTDVQKTLLCKLHTHRGSVVGPSAAQSASSWWGGQIVKICRFCTHITRTFLFLNICVNCFISTAEWCS